MQNRVGSLSRVPRKLIDRRGVLLDSNLFVSHPNHLGTVRTRHDMFALLHQRCRYSVPPTTSAGVCPRPFLTVALLFKVLERDELGGTWAGIVGRAEPSCCVVSCSPLGVGESVVGVFDERNVDGGGAVWMSGWELVRMRSEEDAVVGGLYLWQGGIVWDSEEGVEIRQTGV